MIKNDCSELYDELAFTIDKAKVVNDCLLDENQCFAEDEENARRQFDKTITMLAIMKDYLFKIAESTDALFDSITKAKTT
jgi:hypothetical protein